VILRAGELLVCSDDCVFILLYHIFFFFDLIFHLWLTVSILLFLTEYLVVMSTFGRPKLVKRQQPSMVKP